ncbi:MAG: PAS domain S-box-containing protein/diguanylate cyclase (GGDEF)-like protein [Sulfurimonas sp.]|jgi:PAS domain S-box-containing protein/diguanylate cyclase (GGDEF)-like protein|uniref:cache domain-containing protein n=1 Tax=Sulfurimonas sp. TaxID=2022749 RepID=UPI0039E41E29
MKFSLSKISFGTIIITALIFSVVIGIFTIIITNNSYEERIQQQEKDYIKENKELVKREISRAIKRINIIHDIVHNSLIHGLEQKVDFVSSLFRSPINDSLNKTQLLKKYKNELDLLKWDEGSGYFYIFDSDGIILYHGNDNTHIHKHILDIAKKNKELVEFLNGTLKKGENIGSYRWTKPHTGNHKLHEKYVYAKKIEHLNIYIAAGVYKDEVVSKIQKMVFQELKEERFGKNNYGYFWIHDLDYTMLLHPITKELVGTNLKDFKTNDGQYFMRSMNKLVLEQTSGYVSYMWKRPDSALIDQKISYVHLIKEWDMVIGSGFYLTELKKIHEEERESLKKALNDNLQKILFILGILMILSFLSSLFISKRIKKIESLQKENLNMLKQYKLILDKSSVVSKTDKEGMLTYVNKNFTKVSGYKLEEIIGNSHNIVRHPESPKSQFKTLWKTISAGKIWTGLIKNRTKNGDSYYNNTTIVPIKDSDGTIIEYISSGSDVTELIEKRSKLKSIFSTDSLTGLGNRVSLINTLNHDTQGVLVLINIDRFKELNDLQGYSRGDIILKEFSSRLFDFIADEKYTLYRVEADIFALYTLDNGLESVIEKITHFMDTVGEEAYISQNSSFILTYTAGIASKNENLFTYADMALSEAKNKKVRIKVYEQYMNNIEEYKQNILWVKKLHLAIAEDRIVPFYQPIYNYHTGKVDKYECLMRLIEDGKTILPDNYLKVAKKTKLYPQLTYIMVAKSIDKFALSWEEFSINFSIEDLMNEELMQFVYHYAQQKNVFKRLVFEIVESEEIKDNDSISKILSRFKEEGVQIAIDDFGNGYSNFSYLISLKANYIKIDGSIIEYILEDESALEVVKSLVHFAKKSNMKTIAEYVSSKELDTMVKYLGIDYAQGYHYGRAKPELL